MSQGEYSQALWIGATGQDELGMDVMDHACQ